jgi:hypothetical protein
VPGDEGLLQASCKLLPVVSEQEVALDRMEHSSR